MGAVKFTLLLGIAPVRAMCGGPKGGANCIDVLSIDDPARYQKAWFSNWQVWWLFEVGVLAHICSAIRMGVLARLKGVPIRMVL